jgi:hypothetical protein
MLRMRVIHDEWLEIHHLGDTVAEEDVKTDISGIFRSNYV